MGDTHLHDMHGCATRSCGTGTLSYFCSLVQLTLPEVCYVAHLTFIYAFLILFCLLDFLLRSKELGLGLLSFKTTIRNPRKA